MDRRTHRWESIDDAPPVAPTAAWKARAQVALKRYGTQTKLARAIGGSQPRVSQYVFGDEWTASGYVPMISDELGIAIPWPDRALAEVEELAVAARELRAIDEDEFFELLDSARKRLERLRRRIKP